MNAISAYDFDPCGTKSLALLADRINSLFPGKFGSNFRFVILTNFSAIDILSISFEGVLRWMPQDIIKDKSALVQATSKDIALNSIYQVKFLNIIWHHQQPRC